jgi:hypothetical protein
VSRADIFSASAEETSWLIDTPSRRASSRAPFVKRIRETKAECTHEAIPNERKNSIGVTG